jgi:N-acetylmuramoyl-L-alanine amidase
MTPHPTPHSHAAHPHAAGAQQAAKITVKVKNRLIPTEVVASCTVTFQLTGGASVAAVSQVTNRSGQADFITTGWADGRYAVTVRAPGAISDPVGPDTGRGSTADRIFRLLTLTAEIKRGAITSISNSTPLNGTAVSLDNGKQLRVTLQPVWMKSPANAPRSGTISMIIVHHTAASTSSSINTFLGQRSPHYMIDTDGQIIKFVQENLAAQHAGVANWNGESHVNGRSIGIEIVNTAEPYSEAIYSSLLDLLGRLTAKFTNIDTWNIIGHSDVGVGQGHLGRKSGDPGPKFDWRRLEAKGFGLIPAANGFDAAKAYAGFFSKDKTGALQLHDSDAAHKFGGVVRKNHAGTVTMPGTPVQELQQDLTAIGYFVGPVTGVYNEATFSAVEMLQEHFFAGGRSASVANGKLDLNTASIVKSLVARLAINALEREITNAVNAVISDVAQALHAVGF